MRSILLRANNLEAVKDFRDCPCPLAPKLSRKRRTAFSAAFLQKCEAQSKSFHRYRARREASFYSPANLAPDEGNSCAKSVSRNGTISLTSLDAVLITSLALKTLIKERCLSSGVNSAVFRVVLRLCLTPERKRTALTPNHWTRKSTALCPPTLLTAQKSECEETECN